jgi:hypothetical protein
MGALGALLRGDLHRETTSPTVLDLVRRQIAVMNSDAGKRKGTVRQIGVSRMSAVERMTEEQQIRSGSVWRSAAVSRSAAAWTRIDVGKPLASLSAWPARGPWRTSVAWRKKPARAIAGRIALRCCLAPLRTWRIFIDLPM